MSTMSAENNSIKRRKIDGSASTDAYCLTDLPKEALIHVATFLAAPSRALFAASLDGSWGSSSDENVSAIFPSNQLIGSGGSVDFREISAQLDQSHVQQILWKIEALNQTDILDFGKIQKEYVVQLCDDGVKTVLLCVDAVNTVKRLKLANCINITGHGLEPLRGSTMIEQIDLSLVGKHQSPGIYTEPPISCDAVMPILDSIISQNGCALKHLQFPEKWQRARVEHTWWNSQLQEHSGYQFRQLISGYEDMLTNRGGVRCQCNENLPRQGGEWMYVYGIGRYEDIGQNYTCYECLKNYCSECGDDHVCRWCKRMYCQQCEEMNNCDDCDEYFCVDCKEVVQCAICDRSKCKDCVGMECFECGYICSFCLDNMDMEENRRDCKCCGKSFCPDCEYERDDEIAPCTGCVQLASLELAEENEQLKKDVEFLKDAVKRLKIGTRKLRKRLSQRN